MRVNIQNMLRQAGHAIPSHRDTGAYSYVLQQLSGHLLQLRDRTQAGDLTALDEFFNLYVFDDGKHYARSSQETGARPDSCNCPAAPGEDCKLTDAECKRRSEMNR